MTPLGKSHATQVFHFAGTNDGAHFFRGVCLAATDDPQKIALIGRTLVRYAFEPGGPEPRVEALPLEPASFAKRDYFVRLTEGPPPPWWPHP